MKYLKLLTDNPQPDVQTQSYTPYILSLIANLIFPFAWIYCNEQNISISENAIIRGLATTCFHFMACRLTDSPLEIKDSRSIKFLTIRSVIVALYMLMFSLSQFILPLPAVHAINCSGEIFIFVVDYFRNGVKINFQQAIGVFVGLIGVLVAGNGRVIMELIDNQYVQTTNFQHYITDDIRIMAVFTVLFVLTMALFAYAACLTKQINGNSYQIMLFMGLMWQFTGYMSYPYTSNQSTYTTLLIAIILTGIPLTIVQGLYIAALRMTKNTGLVSVMGFSCVVTSYFISIFRYSQKPNIVTNFGVVLVLVGLWRTIFGK